MAGHPDVARRHRRQAVPGRRHHGAGGPSHPEVRLLSDQPRPRRARRGADQLDLRPAIMGEHAMLPREDWNRPGKLEDFLPRFEDWNFGWLDVPDVIRDAARHLRIPHGRPRSAAALEPWPRHAAGRCRASDVPDRLERRLAGDHRRRGDHPGTVGRRRSRSGPAALRAAPPAADGAHRREQPAQGHRRHARHRRAARAAGILRIWKACCRPTSSNASSATTRSSPPRTARRCSAAGGRDNKKPAPLRDRPW